MKKLLILCLLLAGCSNLPASHNVEVDLCEARAAFKVIETADSGLQPKPDSIRAKIEADEDALCSVLK